MAERLTSRRNALTCAGVQSSQNITGTFSQLQFPSRLQAHVPVDNFPIAAYQQREHKSELFERGDHAVDRIVVSPQSSGIGKKPCDRLYLNFRLSHLSLSFPTNR